MEIYGQENEFSEKKEIIRGKYSVINHSTKLGVPILQKNPLIFFLSLDKFYTRFKVIIQLPCVSSTIKFQHSIFELSKYRAVYNLP